MEDLNIKKIIITKNNNPQIAKLKKSLNLVEYYSDNENLGIDIEYEDIRPYTEQSIDQDKRLLIIKK